MTLNGQYVATVESTEYKKAKTPEHCSPVNMLFVYDLVAAVGFEPGAFRLLAIDYPTSVDNDQS